MMKKTTPRRFQPGADLSGELFDYLRKKHGLKNDRELGDFFELHRSSVSRVRRGHGPVSLAMRHAIMSKDKMTVSEIDALIKRPRFKVQPVATQEAQ